MSRPTSSERSRGPRGSKPRGTNRARKRRGSHRDGSVVVELVGPAGSGKTTLARSIHRDDARVHVGLSLWGLPRRRLVRGAVSLVPTIVGSALRKRRLRWREITQMIRLEALRRVLRRMKSRHRIILLDEGPVFGISWLDLAFAKRGAEPPTRWRRRVLERWARVLDSVILIDAGDALLASRIRTRSKTHRMRKRSDRTIRHFAEGFRSAFESVIDELRTAGRIVVSEIHTDGTLAQAAARLRTALSRSRHGQ